MRQERPLPNDDANDEVDLVISVAIEEAHKVIPEDVRIRYDAVEERRRRTDGKDRRRHKPS